MELPLEEPCVPPGVFRCSGGLTRCERIDEKLSSGYSPPRRGGVDAPSIKWIRSEIGAAGVARSASPRGRSLNGSAAKLFRPKHFAELPTITASRYRARASRPPAASSLAARLLLVPQPSPPLRGGEYPELNISSISSHLLRPPTIQEFAESPVVKMEYELPEVERRLCLICTVPRMCSIPATIGV